MGGLDSIQVQSQSKMLSREALQLFRDRGLTRVRHGAPGVLIFEFTDVFVRVPKTRMALLDVLVELCLLPPHPYTSYHLSRSIREIATLVRRP